MYIFLLIVVIRKSTLVSLLVLKILTEIEKKFTQIKRVFLIIPTAKLELTLCGLY